MDASGQELKHSRRTNSLASFSSSRLLEFLSAPKEQKLALEVKGYRAKAGAFAYASNSSMIRWTAARGSGEAVIGRPMTR